MENTSDFINAAGSAVLATVLRDFVLQHERFPSPRREDFAASVFDLVAANPHMVCILASNEPFCAKHPEMLQALLRRANSKACTAAARDLLRVAAASAGPLLGTERSLPTITLTASQARALRHLEANATLYFNSPVRHGIKLRALPLILAPSGSGKTHLVRHLGEKLSLPIFKATVGDWLPLGAKGETPTMTRLATMLAKESAIIVHIDELDKLRTYDSAWERCVLGEVYCLLDRQPGPSWSKEAQAKLRDHTFIVGAGTWQDLWNLRDRGKVGFGCKVAANPSAEISGLVRSKQIIPHELLARFNGEFCVIEPMSEEDFMQLARDLNLAPGILDAAAGAQSGLNMRYLENSLTAQALRELEGALGAEDAPF